MDVLESYITYIEYLKRRVRNEAISDEELNRFALDIVKEIDRLCVEGGSTLALDRLYEEVRWLQYEVSQ